MKGFEEIFPLIVAFLVAVALFFGVVISIGKSLKEPQEPEPADSVFYIKEQQRRLDDVQRQQKELMESQRQRIRDLQRR